MRVVTYAVGLSPAQTTKLLNKAPCQGTCQFMSYTEANKTYQGKTCQGKLGRLHVRGFIYISNKSKHLKTEVRYARAVKKQSL